MLPLDCILEGDCVEVMDTLPARSVDVIFADPPYNMQLGGDLYRPDMSRVDAVDDGWDKFESLAAYDAFTRRWLAAARRVLKDNGTLWVIGSYHNIYRVGTALMDLDYWILNEVCWHKRNPTPNMKGTRFTNSHETLIWAQKHKGRRYTFNYSALKAGNEDTQMRSVWELPICSGAERLTVGGHKAHTTQKPEALLYRVLISSTNPGDIVLDPFFGTGTTGAVAKRLRRHWLGIERDPQYITVAQPRIDAIAPATDNAALYAPSNKPRLPRFPFVRLLETGLLSPGQTLRLDRTGDEAVVTADGSLAYDGRRASIHMLGRELTGAPCNGWEHWLYHDPQTGAWQPIDRLRQQAREM